MNVPRDIQELADAVETASYGTWTSFPYNPAAEWLDAGGGLLPVKYRKTFDSVSLQGSAKLDGDEDQLALGTLPSGYRPAGTVYLQVVLTVTLAEGSDFTGAVPVAAVVSVTSGGVLSLVTTRSPGHDARLALDGVRFPT